MGVVFADFLVGAHDQVVEVFVVDQHAVVFFDGDGEALGSLEFDHELAVLCDHDAAAFDACFFHGLEDGLGVFEVRASDVQDKGVDFEP